MRPVRLKLKGFTSFREEQDVDFQTLDLFAIAGPTGAGKSSLLDAMTYALYGWVERVHGEFRNPEQLAYGLDGLPRQPLYMVGFRQTDLWHQRYAESPRDNLYVDIYEHWLEADK